VQLIGETTVYYHRLDKDLLFKALLNYVEPKIRREESRAGELRAQKTALGTEAKGAKKLDKELGLAIANGQKPTLRLPG